MLEQILDGLFFGFLIYMLTGVVFALLRSPRFYELVLLVAAPLGTYHYTNDFQASLMAFAFCGLIVVLAETVFQPERNRATKRPTRPIDLSSRQAARG
jgi:ABC-type Fe3+ transport system permease subunit